MVPPVGLVIPYFLILNRVGWLDSYQGMITVYLTFPIPIDLFIKFANNTVRRTI